MAQIQQMSPTIKTPKIGTPNQACAEFWLPQSVVLPGVRFVIHPGVDFVGDLGGQECIGFNKVISGHLKTATTCKQCLVAASLPGGPYSSTPLGGRAPRRSNAPGLANGHCTASCKLHKCRAAKMHARVVVAGKARHRQANRHCLVLRSTDPANHHKLHTLTSTQP